LIDGYYLSLGKTQLEYAQALANDPTHTATRAQAITMIQQALQVFQRAEKNNPLNPDHPRNVAKLYDLWGLQLFPAEGVQPDKLELADKSFATAAALAPHNSDIQDEWAAVDLQLGIYNLSLKTPAGDAKAHQWYALAREHLLLSQALFPESGNAYRDLGTVYAQYAQWAEDRKDAAGALKYHNLERDAWLQSLGGPPVTVLAQNYQAVYPRLAALDMAKLPGHLCEAGQYAIFGLQALQQGYIADPNGTIASTMQSIIAQARSKACPLKQQ